MRQVCEFSVSQEDDDILNQFKLKVKQHEICNKIVETYPDQQEQIFFSDSRLIRFLYARDKNIDKATQMWFEWAKWYIEIRPETIKKEEIQEEIDAKKAFWFKQDNKNNPCLIVLIRNHIPVHEKIEQARRFFIYLMEEGIRKAEKNGTHRLTIIWDGKGFQKSQLNSAFLDFIKLVAKSLQDYYPNRLAAVYVTDPDFLFRLGFTILKPFLSKVITSKIHQIPMKDLPKYFNPDCIYPEHGGDQNNIELDQSIKSLPIISQKLQNGQQNDQNYLKVDHSQNHLHQPNELQNGHSHSHFHTDEFHSLANDSHIFYDIQNQQNGHHNQENPNKNVYNQGYMEDKVVRDQSCCSKCTIF